MSLALAEAWAPAEKLSASEWAERYRKLPRRGQAEPGRYLMKRTPYLREILDTLGDHYTQEVILMKPPQFGGSQLGRSAIGYWVDTRGDPILLVYPNEDAAAEEIVERVAPMFQESPQLARHLTGRIYDANEAQITLAGCTIYVAWTGSAQAMASRVIGCVVYEETDKTVRKTKEADAYDLLKHRTKTFRDRRKIFSLSTPTDRSMPIFRLYNETKHKRAYECPCTSCGASTVWGFEHVRWTGRLCDESGAPVDAKNPEALLGLIDALLSGEARAWIECPSCRSEIHENDRMQAVEGGQWIWVGAAPKRKPKRVAYHGESLLSPWVSLAEYVEAYLRGVLSGDLTDFYNGFRGLPSEEISGKVDVSVFEERAKAHQAWIVPEWATLLTAGADTQATGGRPWWAWVIRAWGPGLKSRLIGWGRADSPRELVARTVDAAFPVEGGMRHPMRPVLLCVDSGGGMEVESGSVDGSTTDLVYGLSKSDPARIVAVKGHGGGSRPDRMVSPRNVEYQHPGMPPTTVLLHVLDTERLKDVLSRLIRSDAPVLWEESSAADKTYVEQMTAEERVLMRLGRKRRMAWVNTTRRRNDLWDATVYALAAAKIVKVEERALALEATAADRGEVVAEDSPASVRGAATTRGDEQKTRFGGRIRTDQGQGRKWISKKGSR